MITSFKLAYVFSEVHRNCEHDVVTEDLHSTECRLAHSVVYKLLKMNLFGNQKTSELLDVILGSIIKHNPYRLRVLFFVFVYRYVDVYLHHCKITGVKSIIYSRTLVPKKLYRRIRRQTLYYLQLFLITLFSKHAVATKGDAIEYVGFRKFPNNNNIAFSNKNMNMQSKIFMIIMKLRLTHGQDDGKLCRANRDAELFQTPGPTGIFLRESFDLLEVVRGMPRKQTEIVTADLGEDDSYYTLLFPAFYTVFLHFSYKKLIKLNLHTTTTKLIQYSTNLYRVQMYNFHGVTETYTKSKEIVKKGNQQFIFFLNDTVQARTHSDTHKKQCYSLLESTILFPPPKGI